MTIHRQWTGNAFGTNLGNVALELQGEDAALCGVLRMNEAGVGIVVYEIHGHFESPTLTLTGVTTTQIDGVVFGELSITGEMNAKGELRGKWETTLGSGGYFCLFPNLQSEVPSDSLRKGQLHTARHSFSAIMINRDEITQLAQSIARTFPQVIVSVVIGTDRAFELEDFKVQTFSSARAESIRIYAQKPDQFGFNQIVAIEFGPNINIAMTQGPDEAWVLGQLETFKRELKRYQRFGFTSFKRFGVNFASIAALAAVSFLPSLDAFLERLLFCCAVALIFGGVNWASSRLLPHAVIDLQERKRSALARFWPEALTWLMAIVGSVIATLLATHFESIVKMPSSQSVPTEAARSKG